MAYVTLEEAQRLSIQSRNESWKLMKEILIEQGLEKVANRLGPPPIINWVRLRSSQVAGYYHFPKMPHPGKIYTCMPPLWNDCIEMNIKYLDSKDALEFIWNTTKHELGHCINYRINKRRNHDASFRAIVRAIGGDPSTYHNFEDSEVGQKRKKQTKIDITCSCGAILRLSPLKVKRAKEGRYICKRCKRNLKELFN